jgi:hypothetical protein
MSIQSPGTPVHGMTPLMSHESTGSSLIERSTPKARDTGVRDEDLQNNDSSRLARLARGNEQLIGWLRRVSDRLRGIRIYLDRADANVGLGTCYYRFWRAKHTIVLTLLRANRIEARRLLAGLDPGMPEGGPVASGSETPPPISSVDSRIR